MAGPVIPKEHDYLQLSGIGYACKLPLGRMQYYSTALTRRAIRFYILHMMADPLVGNDVRDAVADPMKWYQAGTEAIRWQKLEREMKRKPVKKRCSVDG